MNVLILASGSDRAFMETGYQYPKNLIEIGGIPLIQHVLESFSTVIDDCEEIIITVKQEESSHYHTATILKLLLPKCRVLEIPRETMGATCTALLASEFIDNEQPLAIINGDIILENFTTEVFKFFEEKNSDGGAVTFESVHPRWSYVKCDETGAVIEATEKRPISKTATAGVYYYRHGSDFIEAAKDSIRKDARIDGKFYICPVFNEMILKQKKVTVFPVKNKNWYHSLSTPAGVKAYQKYLKEAPR